MKIPKFDISESQKLQNDTWHFTTIQSKIQDLLVRSSRLLWDISISAYQKQDERSHTEQTKQKFSVYIAALCGYISAPLHYMPAPCSYIPRYFTYSCTDISSISRSFLVSADTSPAAASSYPACSTTFKYAFTVSWTALSELFSSLPQFL